MEPNKSVDLPTSDALKKALGGNRPSNARILGRALLIGALPGFCKAALEMSEGHAAVNPTESIELFARFYGALWWLSVVFSLLYIAARLTCMRFGVDGPHRMAFLAAGIAFTASLLIAEKPASLDFVERLASEESPCSAFFSKPKAGYEPVFSASYMYGACRGFVERKQGATR